MKFDATIWCQECSKNIGVIPNLDSTFRKLTIATIMVALEGHESREHTTKAEDKTP